MRNRAVRLAALVLPLATVAASALAADVSVTDSTDDPKSPAPGSFRAVISQAQPGDVVVLDRAIAVALAGDVDIATPNVTVRGPGGFLRAAGLSPASRLPQIRVRADGVTLDGLDLRDVVVAAAPASAKGVLDGFAARSVTIEGRGEIVLRRCGGAVVDQCTIHVDHRNRKGVSLLPAMRDLGSVGTHISHCDVANPDGLGLRATLVTGMLVEDSTFDCDVEIFAGRPKKGAVPAGSFPLGELTFNRNTLADHAVDIEPAGVHLGPVRVRQNTAGRMIVNGGQVDIALNVLGFTPAHPEFRIGTALSVSNSHRDGPMLVSRNRTTGAYHGLDVSCASANALCTVEGNVVDDADAVGVCVRSSDPSVVHGNFVQNGLRVGARIGIALSGDSPSMRAEDNIVHDTGGDGMRAFSKKPGTKLKNNELRDNTGAGIRVQDGAIAAIEIGIVERNGTPGDPAAGDGAGIVILGSRGSSVTGTIVRDNRGAGIYVGGRGFARISRVSCTGNAGLGIDVDPVGVSLGGTKGPAGRMAAPTDLAFDAAAQAVTGTSEPGALVEVYGVEPGPRTGNPENGEGFVFKADGTAGSDGKFSIPVVCNDGDLLTLTATRSGRTQVTSEFSGDVECAGP